MVNQGDIIKINFNPQLGHEQAGYRPALVVSNNFFNENAKLAILCPITNSDNQFPLHIPLDHRTKTKGFIGKGENTRDFSRVMNRRNQ